MRGIGDGLDDPYLGPLIEQWGMDKVALVTRSPATSIYQWKPSRGPVPAEAALLLAEFTNDERFAVERLQPELPWHLVYAGRDRRTSYEGIKDVVLSGNIEQAVKELGVTDVARAADKSRQSVYEALKAVASPVWLVLAVEKASDHRFLVEDFRSNYAAAAPAA